MMKPTALPQPDPGVDEQYLGLADDEFADLLGPDGSKDTNSAHAELVGGEPWDSLLPLGAAEVPPFPTEALPLWLRRFVEEEAEATQTPCDLAGSLTLTALACAAAKKFEIQVKEGYLEPLNLFVVTALPPANRKSAVFSEVIRPIQDFEKEERSRLAPEIEAARSAYKIHEEELRMAEKGAASPRKGEDREQRRETALRLARELSTMPDPALPRFICDDCTPEKLSELLREQNGRMAVFSPEGDIFDIIAGRYSKNATPNFAVFTKGHAGDTLYVDRIGRKGTIVDRPALTLALAVQPDVIHQLARQPGFRGRGLLGRILYSVPISLVGGRDTRPQPLSAEVRAEYHSGLKALLHFSPLGDNGIGTPSLLRLRAEAAQELLAFEDFLEPQLAPTGQLGPISDWAGKLTGAVARIAGLLHLAAQVNSLKLWTKDVEIESVRSAIALGKYFVPHARAAFAMMGSDPAIADAKYLLQAIQKRGVQTFSQRDLFEWAKGKFHRVEGLGPGIQVLERHNYIRQERDVTTNRPGRPRSPSYELNPEIHSHNSQNAHDGSHSANFAKSPDPSWVDLVEAQDRGP